MKESEFIELLNLYVDHEISASDAARLETEVMSNPARRRVYHEYCQMQKACRMLALDGSLELGTDAAAKTIGGFSAAPQHRRSRPLLLAVGSLAAAASVALFLGLQTQRSTKESPTIVGSQSAMPRAVAPAAVVPQKTEGFVSSQRQAPTSGLSQRPLLVGDALLLANPVQAGAEFAAAGSHGAEHLDWIRSLQLAPLQRRVLIEELRFETRPASLRPEARPLGGSTDEPAAEMAAFRFVR